MTNEATTVSTPRAPGLAGQIVVVIGGSAGIGLETARRARAEGADVVLAARNPERLEQAALELGAKSTAELRRQRSRRRWSGSSKSCQRRSTM